MRVRRIVIIGAGHNGLVCGAYLAKAGHQVQIMEADAQVGGAAKTQEFEQGYLVSSCAHLAYQIDQEIIDDLDLKKYGLEFCATNITTTVLAPDGKSHITLRGDELTGPVSGADTVTLVKFNNQIARFADFLKKQYKHTPPRLGSTKFSDLTALAKFGFGMRRLGRTDMREFMRIASINVFDVMNENFDNPLLKAGISMDAVLGSHLGPRSPGSMYGLLHRRSGGGVLSLPQGGFGSVSKVLRTAAEAQGAVVRAKTTVRSVRVDNNTAKGIELESGEVLNADIVISNADPKTTFFDLVGAARLEASFAQRVNNIRMRGNAAKLHFALDALPEFPGVDTSAMGGRLLVAPDMSYIERAFDHAKYREFSEYPTLEIVLPSVSDPSMAPPNKHAMSVVAQYAPHQIKQGWENAIDKFADIVTGVIESYAPGFTKLVHARQCWSPQDIERQFRISGGHWHHGELSLDQFLMLRPTFGAAQYATPVERLYLCGAGSHPGGGIMGIAGRNAAKEILRQRHE